MVESEPIGVGQVVGDGVEALGAVGRAPGLGEDGLVGRVARGVLLPRRARRESPMSMVIEIPMFNVNVNVFPAPETLSLSSKKGFSGHTLIAK